MCEMIIDTCDGIPCNGDLSLLDSIPNHNVSVFVPSYTHIYIFVSFFGSSPILNFILKNYMIDCSRFSVKINLKKMCFCELSYVEFLKMHFIRF